MDRKLAGKIAMVNEIYGRHRLCDRQFTCRSKGEIEKEFFEHGQRAFFSDERCQPCEWIGGVVKTIL